MCVPLFWSTLFVVISSLSLRRRHRLWLRTQQEEERNNLGGQLNENSFLAHLRGGGGEGIAAAAFLGQKYIFGGEERLGVECP